MKPQLCTAALVLVLLLSLSVYSVLAATYLNDNLWRAANDGNLHEVEACIAGGVDINSRNYIGETATLFASENGHTDIVAKLIAAGADVNNQAGGGLYCTDARVPEWSWGDC